MADDQGRSGRWSPFPVQDWSTMPPAAGKWSTPQFPPPVGPPPGRARRAPRRWLPAVVVAVCLTLLAAGLFRADRIGISAAEVVDRFVPVDGAVTHLETSRSESGSAEPVRTRSVVETARRVGPEGLLSLDFTLGTEVIGSVGIDRIRGVPFWRTTATPVAAEEDHGQTTTVYDLSRAIELVAESGPDLTRTYTPAVVVLPASVVDLDLARVDGAKITWHGSGEVGADQTYTAAFEGEVVSPGCVRVAGEIDYAGRDPSVRTLSQLWCTGRGLVATEDLEGDVERRSVETTAPPVEVSTRPTPVDWGDPGDWQSSEIPAHSEEPHLGRGDVAGSPGSLSPVLTSSGVLVRVSAGQDLIGFVPEQDGAAVVSRWRAHPGGTVVSLTAHGDLLLAATSERTLVGYDQRGVRLWTGALGDVMFSAPAVVDDLVLISTLSGEVRALDRHSGETRWQVSLRSDVAPSTAVSADAERTVVMTRGGDLVALATADGTELWRAEVDLGVLTAVVDDQVLVAADSALWGLSAIDGSTRWRLRTGGTPYALQVEGDRGLLRAQQEVVAFDTDGVEHWVRPATEPAVLVGDLMVLVNGDQLVALDRSGDEVAGTGIPTASAGSNRQLIITPGGVWFFDSVWQSWRWSR